METKVRHTIIICGLILLVFAFMTSIRNYTWRTPELLWKDAAAKSPHKARPYVNLGKVYQESGRNQAAFDTYQVAMKLAADRLNANHDDFLSRDMLAAAQSNLGVLLMKAGDVANAEKAFRGSLSLLPFEGPATVNLSWLLIQRGDYREAVELLSLTIATENYGPGFQNRGKLHQNLGIAYAYLADCLNADIHFKKAAEMDPDIEPLQCAPMKGQ